MSRKCLTIVSLALLLAAWSCKPKPESTATDTATTATTDTTVTQTTPPPPPPHAIDHYKLWKVKSIPQQRSVKLKGQFDTDTWEARVASLEYLGNPVEKNTEPILKPDWHLTGYAIKAAPQPPRMVVIDNQFRKGEQLKIGDAAWLLLPASKSLEGRAPEPPREADHYVCYAVQPSDPVTTPVTLVDQFDKKRNDKEEIKQLSAAFFCVPVSKNGEQIYREKEHLAVYKLDPPDPYPITVSTADQFGPQRLSVVQSEFLAVPTFKTDWKKQ